MIFLQSEGKVIILRAGDAYDVLRLSQQETILYLTHMILKPAYGICTFYGHENEASTGVNGGLLRNSLI